MTDKWISVKDKLPEKDEDVLLYSKYDGIKVGYRVTDSPPFSYIEEYSYEREYMLFGYDAEMKSGITHWQPLPSPPKP